MNLKNTNVSKNKDLVEWDKRLSVGIAIMDAQHLELLKMTNALFLACLEGEAAAREYFKASIQKSVEYIRLHFRHEEQLLQQMGYPGLGSHKIQHEEFIMEVLQKARNFESGNKFVPNNFARFLRDWVLTHIAIHDKQYGQFYARKITGVYNNVTAPVGWPA
ncbi:MAG: bacteriohemerythrin [Treponema sp.]|nr:bacteriohemerythrin [Treponema sp.]